MEPRTVEINQKCCLLKRSCDLEQSIPSKRTKSDEQYDSSTDIESKSTSSDTDESEIDQNDDNSDTEDMENDSNLSTDQSPYISVALNEIIRQQQISSFSKHSRKLIKQFQYLYDHSKRKVIEPTQAIHDNVNQRQKLRWELKTTWNRIDLFREGYTVLSDESFPFHSLCYMCGSMGTDLIYCNSCCQAYHTGCLNEFERPRLYPIPESWVCPNCTICNICGLLINSQLLSCSDCQRNFHIKCIKQTQDEQENLVHHHQLWLCPLCIKCDCGQVLTSNERNLLSLTKSVSSQQSLMCLDCLNNMKKIRTNKNAQIEKCHLCEKFIEQFLTKPKPLFSLSLIGHQTPEKVTNLLQCIKCKHRFHPKCDGYLNEDVTLLPYVKNISMNIICSKCDCNQRETIKNSLMNYKIQVVNSTIASIISILQIMISEETRLVNMKRYVSNLQKLHQSRDQCLNLHAFINDLLIIVQNLLNNLDTRQWQAAIDNCISHQCPWFKSVHFSSNNKTLFCSSTNTSIVNTNSFVNHCFLPPSIDHTYSLNNERISFQSSLYKNNLLTSSDSLLRYIDNKSEENYSWENLYQIDTRLCQLCQTYADHFSSNISRLIPIGVNQWVHIGCILPAYTKTLDQPPYVLHDIREIVNRCQTKYKCDVCGKMGASIQCYENDCNAHFHCQCIDIYYSKFDRNQLEKFNIINGLLPNLTTLCSKHNKSLKGNEYETNDNINLSQLKSVNLSSTIYANLSNSIIEFSLPHIQLCIGSLHIKSLGNFDYLLDNDTNSHIYPNEYHASRVFWSTKNARQKTTYHLHIQVEQTYHHDRSNHQTIQHPLTNEQYHFEQLYEKCHEYFRKFERPTSLRKPFYIKCETSKSALSDHRFKNTHTSDIDKHSLIISKENSETTTVDIKSLQDLFNNTTCKSSNLSQFASTLAQALQHPDQSSVSTTIHKPIFSYYLSNQTNGSTNAKDLDEFLKQFVLPQQLKGMKHVVSSDSPHVQPSPTITIQTNATEPCIIPINGNINDYDADDRLTSSSSLLDSLVEQITRNENKHSNSSSNSSEELIQVYQQWITTKFGRVIFTITSDDGYKIESDNLDIAWSNIVTLVRECRDDMKLTHLPMTNEELNGHKIFGLTKPIIKVMLNQVHINALSIPEQTKTIILPLCSENNHSSICSIKKISMNKKHCSSNSRLNVYQRKYSQRQRFSWLLNPNRKIEYALKSFEMDDALAHARRILLNEASISLRLYHLHYFSERALLVGSSSIHGCGLFTLIDLTEGQMIIEYTGEVIRPYLTDHRERENEGKGFGCYMFTVDSTNVIDATHQGNKARFINHNCQPNCFAKTVLSSGVKHIVIYALHDVSAGSELTYDYSFLEEDIKIPCHCGTNKCRIYLN